MCGIIAGLFNKEEANESRFKEARDLLEHRGPDGAGFTRRETGSHSLFLGHRRLSIIDLREVAGQPMKYADGTFEIVFNGEIYNYVELKNELERKGYAFQSTSDTEVLLAAYAEWGVECLSHLNGMFAFALWDERKKGLFVARDRFGEKPLYYSTASTSCPFVMASELKALLPFSGISRTINEGSLEKFTIARYYEDSPETMFRDIRRLMPAHAMWVNGRGEIEREWRYWKPNYDQINTSLSFEQAVTRFRELLTDSVSIRMRSDVPVGTSLSGGLDSSLIVALISESSRELPSFSQNSFSARFDNDPTLSEGPQIDLVLKRTGVHGHFVNPSPDGLVESLRALHWHQEEPFPSASIFLQWSVMKLAKEVGTTVLIDGQGADEILAGYSFYFRSRQLDLLETGHGFKSLVETYHHRRHLVKASRAFSNATRRFNPHVSYSPRELMGLRRAKSSFAATQYKEGMPAAGAGKHLRTQIAEALQYNCLPALLRYADRNSMAFSREVRLPYLDHRLVEFCISLPDDFWIRNGWHKYIQRKSADGLLPKEIQWRADKVGFAAPLDQWLRGPLKEWAHDRLFSAKAQALPYYDRSEIEKTWKLHQSGESDLSWALWRWISLGEWQSLYS